MKRTRAVAHYKTCKGLARNMWARQRKLQKCAGMRSTTAWLMLFQDRDANQARPHLCRPFWRPSQGSSLQPSQGSSRRKPWLLLINSCWSMLGSTIMQISKSGWHKRMASQKTLKGWWYLLIKIRVFWPGRMNSWKTTITYSGKYHTQPSLQISWGFMTIDTSRIWWRNARLSRKTTMKCWPNTTGTQWSRQRHGKQR